MDNDNQRLFDPVHLVRVMEEANMDAVVAHSQRNFYYLTGFNSLDYVIDPEAANFVIVPRSPDQLATITVPSSEQLELEKTPTWVPKQIFCGQFYIQNGPSVADHAASTWDGLVEGLRRSRLQNKRVGFELSTLPVKLYQNLCATFPQMSIVDASPVLRQVRMIKTEEEIRRLRQACQITEQAIDLAAATLRAGMTELEFGNAIATEIVNLGADVLYVQVATGGSAGLGVPTNRVIQEGDVIRTDVSAVYQGYTSDLGRGFVVGAPTPLQQAYYRIAYEALQAGIASIKPGVTAEDVFQSAMQVWARSEFPEVRRHHVGHGLGLQAHEAPMLKPNNKEVLQPGMVLAVEVPCYVYGLGGFAPEDILVVGTERNTQFTHAPAEIPVICKKAIGHE